MTRHYNAANPFTMNDPDRVRRLNDAVRSLQEATTLDQYRYARWRLYWERNHWRYEAQNYRCLRSMQELVGRRCVDGTGANCRIIGVTKKVRRDTWGSSASSRLYRVEWTFQLRVEQGNVYHADTYLKFHPNCQTVGYEHAAIDAGILDIDGLPASRPLVPTLERLWAELEQATIRFSTSEPQPEQLTMF